MQHSLLKVKNSLIAFFHMSSQPLVHVPIKMAVSSQTPHEHVAKTIRDKMKKVTGLQSKAGCPARILRIRPSLASTEPIQSCESPSHVNFAPSTPIQERLKDIEEDFQDSVNSLAHFQSAGKSQNLPE